MNFLDHAAMRRPLHFHLVVALLLGLLLRLCSAWFVYGPQAMDDYYHGVLPAWQLFSGQPPELPDYRSHLLVWMLSGFLSIGSLFGLHTGLDQVRAMYIGLGIFSLLGIVGTWLYVRDHASRLFGVLAIYLVALHPVMSFIGTRAFGEAVALPLVLAGVGLIEWSRKAEPRAADGWVMSGFLLLGLAALFRFQVGLIYLAYMALLLMEREWRLLLTAVLAGVVTLAAQIGIDLASGKQAFGTLWAYLAANAGGGREFGVQPWYNTWAFMLALTLFPFSLVFADQLGRLWREHRTLLVLLLVFVAAHSLVPHKEERFLYPVIGLLWIALAALWAYVPQRRSVRWLYGPLYAVFLLLLAPLALFNNTQAAVTEPFASVLQRYPKALFVDLDGGDATLLRRFFLQPASVLQSTEPQLPLQALMQHPGYPAVVLFGSAASDAATMRRIAAEAGSGMRCDEPQVAGSLADRLLYTLNRKRNERRQAIRYLVCTPEGAA